MSQEFESDYDWGRFGYEFDYRVRMAWRSLYYTPRWQWFTRWVKFRRLLRAMDQYLTIEINEGVDLVD